MRGNLRAVVWRLAVFVTACLFGLFALLAIFAQLRFQDERAYHAHFADVSGLADGQFVRIAGVEVGKVKDIVVQKDSTVMVTFTADETVTVTSGTRAVIRYADLIGGRYLSLEEGAGGGEKLAPDNTIPMSQTAPALDLDALIGGFRPLFRALDPDQVNALSGQLIAALQGEGPTVNSFFSQAAALTNSLADRDQLIGQVITNLNTVLGSLGDQSSQFAKAVDSLSQLMGTLAQSKDDISNTIAYTDAASASITDLLSRGRPPLQKLIHETDRASSIVVADHDYMDNLLNTLPDAYRVMNRQGLYGDYFSFYFCDILLKLNGKGGQPVYVKVAGQDSGRCAPR